MTEEGTRITQSVPPNGTAQLFDSGYSFALWPDHMILRAIESFRAQQRGEVNRVRAGALLREAHARRLTT